jgi:thioredoxin reductase (NADPH)
VGPVLCIVDHRNDVLEALATDLGHRFGMDYDIRTAGTAEAGLAELRTLADDGTSVALVVVAEELPDDGGLDFLEQAHVLHREARRILTVERGRWMSGERIVRAMTLGRLEGILFTPWALLEQYLYPTIGEHLSDWAKERPPEYEAAHIIGKPGDASVHELQQTLFTIGVPFGFYPAGSDAAGSKLAEAGLVEPELPVVLWQDSGRILVRPTHVDLARSLGLRTEPASGRCDVVIIGAGPAGLAAAVYAASEGLDTMVVERTIPGGQAASSSLIRNYLGFTRGISGDGLALRAFEQAWLFGADFVMTQQATGLRADGDDRVTRLTDGTEVRSEAVVLTTGVAWRRMDVPGLDDLIGAGVFYGASQSEARALRGEDVFVIGGGNSAGQAVVHLARQARQVTLLVRGASLAASMSDYLIREIEDASNILVRVRTQVVAASGAGRLEELTLRDAERGIDESVPASALFIMIGAEPHTDWLPSELARDERGFIRTGPAVVQAVAAGEVRWPLERTPFPTETSVPGVFAAGDVVAGSTKRVASAVGGGAMAIESVHRYLATLHP